MMTQRHDSENLTSTERSPGTDHSSNVAFPKIYDFGATFEDGSTPTGRLIVDASGTLYGVTNTGGLSGGDPSGHGVVFRLVPDASGGTYQYHILHSFAGGPSDGARPVGGLLMDAAGALYGTAAGGGSGWTGTVFKLAASDSGGWDLTNLYEFSPLPQPQATNSDGAAPTSHLIMNAVGTLFGTTSNGGTNGGGTVFALTPKVDGGYSFANLYNFGAPQGYDDTMGGLIMDTAENLYGLKAAGGAYDSGEVFGLFAFGDQPHVYMRLYSFPQTDYIRALPMGSLIMDAAGQMFGTTSAGGNNLSGTLFSYPSGSQPATLTTLYAFDDLSGPASPYAGVIMDSAGNLFGTASSSLSGNGVVYKLSNNGDGTYVYATVFEFIESKRQGSDLQNTLVTDSLGHLFGTTSEGGLYDCGVVFKIGGTAQAMAVMEGGVILQIVVTNPGSGYTSPPTVTITPSADGATATAIATIFNGSVTAVSVTNAGSGYDFGPQVIFSSPGL
jgi:uncharacterized repeat protein (TIGR03803 family)